MINRHIKKKPINIQTFQYESIKKKEEKNKKSQKIFFKKIFYLYFISNSIKKVNTINIVITI